MITVKPFDAALTRLNVLASFGTPVTVPCATCVAVNTWLPSENVTPALVVIVTVCRVLRVGSESALPTSFPSQYSLTVAPAKIPLTLSLTPLVAAVASVQPGTAGDASVIVSGAAGVTNTGTYWES